ncbi:MAG: lipopolysaccharide biosynthesis protein [Bacteroidota bacterium]
MFRAIRNIWQTEFFKNVATLISGTTFAQAFSIVIYILLSRIYSEEDFGVFGLYMNILNITIIFSTAKYELAILLPKRDKEAVNLLGLSGLVSAGVSLALLLPVVLLNSQICKWLGSEEISGWLYLIPLSTLLVGLFQSFRNYSNREKKYRLIAGANITQSLGNSLMKLGLGLVIAGATGLIFGVVFGQLVGFLLFFVVYVRNQRHKLGWIEAAEMKRLAGLYSLFPKFNMWQGLINNLSGAFPVFVFSSFFSTAIAGLYTFGYMVIYRPVNLVASAFYQVLYQRFVAMQHRGENILPEALLFIRRTIQWLIIPFVVFGIFAPEIFGFLFSDKWIEAGRYTQIMLPWIFMGALTMPLSFIPDIFRRQQTAMVIDGIRLAVRLAALSVGVMMDSVYLGLALYSGVSTLMTLYSLTWYFRLIRMNNLKNKNE